MVLLLKIFLELEMVVSHSLFDGPGAAGRLEAAADIVFQVCISPLAAGICSADHRVVLRGRGFCPPVQDKRPLAAGLCVAFAGDRPA